MPIVKTQSYNQLLSKVRQAIAAGRREAEAANKKAFLFALRNVFEAQGGMSHMAKRCGIHRVSLYKMLSENGNPEFESILRVF